MAKTQLPTPYPQFTGLSVPSGFQVELVVPPGQILQPTTITFGPDSRLYALTLWGKIYTIDLPNRGGDAPHVREVYDNPQGELKYALGLAFYKDDLYVSDAGRISRLKDSNSDGLYDTVIPLITGLVTLKYSVHSNNSIVFGPDGKLYIGVGSTTDYGPLTMPMEACILRMNPDGTNLEIYAEGFRNPYDLAFSPEGTLFAPDDNPDGLDIPAPEEINLVQQGLNFGFPAVYETPQAPGTYELPIVELPPDSASAGIAYYAASQFPEHYRDGLFLAQWGTADEITAKRGIRNGRAVVFIQFEHSKDGTISAHWEDFMEQDPNAPDLWRPIDITVGPDGGLYVAEYTMGAIYRVIYTGNE